MKITRKEFLKISGACLVALSGKKALAVLDSGANRQASSSTGKVRKQLGMVVDTRKCAKAQGCTKCIDACIQAHNIPSFPNPAHQIKWIWERPFGDFFLPMRPNTWSPRSRTNRRRCCATTAITLPA